MTTARLTSDVPPDVPRILLVEDDPISRAFLSAAIQSRPAVVDAVDSLAEAMRATASQRYDLWLIDAHLPDGSGGELLARLRATQPDTPALAHTAYSDAQVVAALIAQGFDRVLVKPLPAGDLQHAVDQALTGAASDAGRGEAPSQAALPVWDDEAAVHALNGNREHVAPLRDLFLAELPAVHERVGNAFRNEDHAGLHAELHRLRASCGFVGASALGRAAQALDREGNSPVRLREFEQAAQALMEQIERQRPAAP